MLYEGEGNVTITLNEWIQPTKEGRSTMKVYWKERRAGLSLVVTDEAGEEMEVGGIRRTPRGYDGFAKAITYDPGRAQKGFPTIEDARAFVESFHPWDIYGGAEDLEVEPDVLAASGQDPPAITTEPKETPGDRIEIDSPSVASEPVEATVEGKETGQKLWWQFWKRR